MEIPAGLRHSMAGTSGGPAWLARPPAPVTQADGPAAVLKISYPHEEARHEAAALRTWHGHGAVRLIDSWDEDWALLLSRCTPGPRWPTSRWGSGPRSRSVPA